MSRLNTRANAGDDTVPNDPTLYARPVIGPNPRQNVGSDNDTSRGGTPWVGRRGSFVAPWNRRGRVGLSPDNPSKGPSPYSGRGMVNRRSFAITDYKPNNTLDDGVTKEKGAWWQHSNQSPKPVMLGDWPASGPVSPTLRLRTFTWRRTSQGQRNFGLHTNIAWSPRTLPGRDSMVARQQNRLTVARYRGQSFSSTTEILGE